ncbi:MAG: 2-phosphosulfolactate phosphatase [Bacteroidetes bacterium]|nr:2-phosphosulfolactate phosphatase [Bacteroidota bacterium]
MRNARNVEVCFTPSLLEGYTGLDSTVVVIDIFRATSSICTAFSNGVKSLLPVATTEEAMSYKELGFLVAGERDGLKLDFADFGNSPYNFARENIEGRSVVYTTTNGTSTIHQASRYHKTIIGSFLNAGAVVDYLAGQDRNALLLCAGWKGRFNLEDTLCAGYIAKRLLGTGGFHTNCDSAHAAIDIWNFAEKNPRAYIEKAAHRKRLREKGLDDCIDFCLTIDYTSVVPVLVGNELVKLDKKT